jgi:hypothetical protein
MAFRTIGAHLVRLGLMAAGLLLVTTSIAQNPPAPPANPAPATSADEGKDIGGFHVTQSVELGGRIADVTGSQAMYNTLVNYQTGARILEQSLTMQSLTHQEVFDTLTMNSFGWGGDPEQAARLRIAKHGLYNFSGTYQHMQNYFNYDLLTNPLNPSVGASPFIPILSSPHSFYDRQNLYNFDLVVLPMHRLSFRVGYNRNRISGLAFSSVHQGTESLNNQNWDTTLNGYRFGADFRINPKTTLSYTQSLQYYNGGPTESLNFFNSWPLSNGQLVSFGLPWFNSGSPCSAPLKNGIANPVCNGYFNYTLFQHENTSIPTEQLNFTSSSLHWLDFTGQYQYSHAHSNTPLGETFSGLTTRTNVLAYNTNGSSSKSRWNSSSADVSATIHVNDQTRLVETFRFRNFSVAGTFFDQEAAFFNAASLGAGSLLNPIAIFPPTKLTHSSSSPADITNEINVNMIGQKSYGNDLELQYDITKSFGIRTGFVWNQLTIQPGDTFQAALGDIYYPNTPNRGNCVGVPLNPDGSCTFIGEITPWGSPTTTINRYSAVLGAWFRGANALHANITAQVGGADNWIYRTDPTTFFNVKANVSYAPRPWLMVGGNFILQQALNNTPDIQFNQHNYVTMFNATITPGKHWSLDLAYNFDWIQQNTILCFEGAVVPPGSTTCLGDNTLMQTYAVYQTHTQYGYVAFTITPIERVTARVGYNVVDNQGNTTSFNTLLPLGPLSSTYQSPLAGVDVVVHKNVMFKAAYNYYQYNEGSFVGPTAPRYFHSNNTTLALRYSF